MRLGDRKSGKVIDIESVSRDMSGVPTATATPPTGYLHPSSCGCAIVTVLSAVSSVSTHCSGLLCCVRADDVTLV